MKPVWSSESPKPKDNGPPAELKPRPTIRRGWLGWLDRLANLLEKVGKW